MDCTQLRFQTELVERCLRVGCPEDPRFLILLRVLEQSSEWQSTRVGLPRIDKSRLLSVHGTKLDKR